MLIQRSRKIIPICKVLLASTQNECFTLRGCRRISSSPIMLHATGTDSSLSCACSSAGSHAAILEAQDALFDYLYCTRGLYHTDAEYISKHSPIFLQHLISRVEKEQHMKQPLVRYLRYHPINEFEPFFESLGLKPSEFLPLLPSKLMFLSDDMHMLELFHVLCNYGFPRDKIGKIYKEAGVIFRSDSDLLISELECYEDLGLSKAGVIKLIASCPELLIGGFDKDFLRVWEKLKTLGFKEVWVEAFLDEKNTYRWNRIIGLLDFFGSIGCTDVELAKLLETLPRFIFDDSGDKIYVVIALLLKAGLTMSEVLGFLVGYPRVLAGNFAKNLWEAVHFLHEVGMGAEEVKKIVKSQFQFLGSNTLIKPRYAMQKLKMNAKMIRDLIREDPNELSRLAGESNTNRTLIVNTFTPYLAEKTSFLLKMGFVENSEEMMKALIQCRGRGDQLQERFDCLINAGLDYDVATDLIRYEPSLLNQSRVVMQKKIDYLINSMGQPIEFVSAFPKYFHFSTSRVDMRLKMCNWLKKKGVATKLALSTLLCMPENLFLKHISLHPKGLKEWKRLKMLSSRGCGI